MTDKERMANFEAASRLYHELYGVVVDRERDAICRMAVSMPRGVFGAYVGLSVGLAATVMGTAMAKRLSGDVEGLQKMLEEERAKQ